MSLHSPLPLLTVMRCSALSQYPCFAALFPLKGDAPFSSLPQRLEKLYGEICGELGGQPMQCRALQVCFSSCPRTGCEDYKL